METRKIDLEGVPEPIARGLEVLADMARKLSDGPAPGKAALSDLPVWSLGVIGKLTRDEIYDDDRDAR